jgi:hypothetical protein
MLFFGTWEEPNITLLVRKSSMKKVTVLATSDMMLIAVDLSAGLLVLVSGVTALR